MSIVHIIHTDTYIPILYYYIILFMVNKIVISLLTLFQLEVRGPAQTPQYRGVYLGNIYPMCQGQCTFLSPF